MGSPKLPHLSPVEKALLRLQARRSHATEGLGTNTSANAPKTGPSRDDARDFVRELRAAVETLAEDIRSANPRYNGLVPNMSVSVTRKLGGSGKVVRAIIEEILSPAGARKTQKAIREDIEARLGERVFKGWTVPLQGWARTRLQTRIQQAGPPFDTIPVSQVRTLSDLWRFARAAVMNANGEAFKLRTTLRIGEGYVFIGDSSFKVSVNKSNGYEYKQIRVRVDELLRLVS